VVEFPRSGQEKKEQGRVREEKLEDFKMTFTGTLIEDLMATVERAEQRAQLGGALPVETSGVETLLAEPWLASLQENTEYNSKFLGVA